MSEIREIFAAFRDASGAPITGGALYIGAPNLNPITNPQAVYTDRALTTAIAQPITISGSRPVDSNGTPVQIFTDGAFSVALYDSGSTLVYSAQQAFPPGEMDGLYLTRTQSNAELAVGEPDGSVIIMGGLPYLVDSTATGANSATNDLSVDGLVPFGIPDPRHFGCIGDGATDDTATLRAAAAWAKSHDSGLHSPMDLSYKVTDDAGIWLGSDDASDCVRGASLWVIAAFDASSTGGTVFDLTGIQNGHRDNFDLKVTVASGFTPAYGATMGRPKQGSGVKSSGNAGDVKLNIVGPFLGACLAVIQSESNVHQSSLLQNEIGPALIVSKDDWLDGCTTITLDTSSDDFAVGNTLTGGTSGATGTILRKADTLYEIEDPSGVFTYGETATGGTSGATFTVRRTTTIIFLELASGTPVGGETVTGGTSTESGTLTMNVGKRLLVRMTSGAYTDGETVTDGASGSDTVDGTPIELGCASPNATLGLETGSTATLQTFADIWMTNGDTSSGVNDALWPVTIQRNFGSVTWARPNVTHIGRGDLMEFHGDCGVNIDFGYLHSVHRYSTAWGDPADATSQVMKRAHLRGHNAGNAAYRLKVLDSNVRFDDSLINLDGAIDYGAGGFYGACHIALGANALIGTGQHEGSVTYDSSGANFAGYAPAAVANALARFVDTTTGIVTGRREASETIASGEITANAEIIRVFGEGAAADVLTDINLPSNMPPGRKRIYLAAGSNTQQIEVRAGTGNIRARGSAGRFYLSFDVIFAFDWDEFDDEWTYSGPLDAMAAQLGFTAPVGTSSKGATDPASATTTTLGQELNAVKDALIAAAILKT